MCIASRQWPHFFQLTWPWLASSWRCLQSVASAIGIIWTSAIGNFLQTFQSFFQSHFTFSISARLCHLIIWQGALRPCHCSWCQQAKGLQSSPVFWPMQIICKLFVRICFSTSQAHSNSVSSQAFREQLGEFVGVVHLENKQKMENTRKRRRDSVNFLLISLDSPFLPQWPAHPCKVELNLGFRGQCRGDIRGHALTLAISPKREVSCRDLTKASCKAWKSHSPKEISLKQSP